ncbi:F-box/kelch-repeat protein At3g23880-like [Rosa chinensis]|uniref:F-box/kelch-repeat protein At3g23880-like n=1 Tax=Rosa chinensis TaxID=74649 RepID=UPI000D096371|nr:F-box/kelch-repeat protein At3g23880-like [Rosa chinensis]
MVEALICSQNWLRSENVYLHHVPTIKEMELCEEAERELLKMPYGAAVGNSRRGMLPPKLPVKSLLQFKSVRKSWLSLISSTEECVEVKEGNGEDSHSLPLFHGFGYDYNSDDYKVISVLYQSKTATFKSMIYTLRTNTWRRIQDYPLSASLTKKCATFVSGALYWLVRRIVNIDAVTKVIISLDLISEAYMEVPQPDYGTNTCYDQYGVGALEGCLCLLVCNITSRAQNELWVMKEYGVKESWTKYLTIPQPLGCEFLITLSR